MGFIPLNEIDTKEMRKALGLPITKNIKYLKKNGSCIYEMKVVDYNIVDTYQPSGTKSLLITLDDGEEIRILADYLAEMQSSDDVKLLSKAVSDTPSTYIVVDIETTGLDHFRDDIIELGAIKYVDGNEKERFSALVKTKKTLSNKIIDLTGITNDMLNKEGQDLAEVIRKFYAFAGQEVIVGHNFASFDRYFIDDAFRKCLGAALTNGYVDTLYLARKKHPDLKKHNLEEMASVYDIDYSKAHRAVADCEINHYVYEYLAFDRILNGEKPNAGVKTDVLSNESDVDTTEVEELITIEDEELNQGWKGALSMELCRIISEKALPSKSLCIKGNKGKKNETITSYTICICEPNIIEDKNDLEKVTRIINIKENVRKTDSRILNVEPNKENGGIDLVAIPDGTTLRNTKTSSYFQIGSDDEGLIPYLVKVIECAVDNYTSKSDRFACCSRYKECSKAKKCVHPNLLYSTSCSYRKNLDNGRVFY